MITPTSGHKQGDLIGYARILTSDHDVALQLDAPSRQASNLTGSPLR